MRCEDVNWIHVAQDSVLVEGTDFLDNHSDHQLLKTVPIP
jgi:hypothetical protein